MQMHGEQLVVASPKRVWEELNNPETLRASIPGCQTLDREGDDRFIATVEVKVGPIGARFKGSVALTDLNPPNSYTLILEGNGGIAGTVKGAAKVRLTEKDGGTLVAYEVDAQVGGRMAQLGGPIIDATAKQLAGKFFRSFGDIVSGAKQSTAASAGSTSVRSKAAATDQSVAMPARSSCSAWPGIAIGLLIVLVAGASFEYGRRTAAPTIVLESELLSETIEQALNEGIKQ